MIATIGGDQLITWVKKATELLRTLLNGGTKKKSESFYDKINEISNNHDTWTSIKCFH